MTDAVISGTYSDLKFIKTRSVAQVVVEIAIEQADEFLKLFGAPQPGKEIPVAIARLRTGVAKEGSSAEPRNSEIAGSTPAPGPKERRPFHSLPLSQQAGMLCEDARFREFLKSQHLVAWLGACKLSPQDSGASDLAAYTIRVICDVKSRRELDDEEKTSARNAFFVLVAEYDMWKLDQQYADNVR